MAKKNFSDWFDPNNMDHMRAYKHLQKTGVWPSDFVPKNVEMNSNWCTLISYKIADAWCKEKLGV